MLSIQSPHNAGWRTPLLNVIEGGTDIDNDAAVRKAFDDALDFAKREGIPYTIREEHHANQYLRTRSLRTGPIIPRYVRAYCAHKLRLKCVEIAPDYGFPGVGTPFRMGGPDRTGRKSAQRLSQSPRMNLASSAGT